MKAHITIKDGNIVVEEIRRDGTLGLNLYNCPVTSFADLNDAFASAVDRVRFDNKDVEFTADEIHQTVLEAALTVELTWESLGKKKRAKDQVTIEGMTVKAERGAGGPEVYKSEVNRKRQLRKVA